MRPVLDLMQTHPDLRLPDPDAGPVRPRHGAGPDLDGDLRHPGADPPHPSRHLLGAEAAASRPARPSAPRRGSCCGRSSCPTRCRPSWPASPSASCCRLSMVVIAALVGADGLGKPVVRALNTVNVAHGLRGRPRHRRARHHARPRLQRPARRRKARDERRRVAFERRRHRLRRRQREARAARCSTPAATRDEILAATGAVLGVAGATLTVERGEICVLMGLSGSGKSTLLRAVNGLNAVTRGARARRRTTGGTVDVANCDAETLRAPAHARASPWCSSSSRCCPGARSRENVGFGLELRGMPKAERDADRRREAGAGRPRRTGPDKYAHELSGGMQQRVGLARAFATDADDPADGRAVLGARPADPRPSCRTSCSTLQQRAAARPSSSSATTSTRR